MNTDNLVIAAMSFLVSSMNFTRFYEKKRPTSLIFGIAYAVMGILYAGLTFRSDKSSDRGSHQ